MDEGLRVHETLQPKVAESRPTPAASPASGHAAGAAAGMPLFLGTPERPAPENPLIDAMQVFNSLQPSKLASGIYEGDYQGRHLSLSKDQYDVWRSRVRQEVLNVFTRASIRADTALGRYQKGAGIGRCPDR